MMSDSDAKFLKVLTDIVNAVRKDPLRKGVATHSCSFEVRTEKPTLNHPRGRVMEIHIVEGETILFFAGDRSPFPGKVYIGRLNDGKQYTLRLTWRGGRISAVTLERSRSYAAGSRKAVVRLSTPA